MKFVARENTEQKIKMNVDFRKSFTMTTPMVDCITANMPFVDKYAIEHPVYDGTNQRLYFVGAKKIYVFNINISGGEIYFKNIVKTQVNTVDSLYYLDSGNNLIVSGGIYCDTGLPCYKSYKYTFVSNGGFTLNATLLADGEDTNNTEQNVTQENFGVMGDSVNDKLDGQLYVLNYRCFGSKDKDGLYYSGKSAFMHDGLL